MDSIKLVQHASLTTEQWSKLSLYEQMGNIGSEVSRSLKWYQKNPQRFQGAFDRALELFDLTIAATPRDQASRLHEICRAREEFCDYFYGHELKTDPVKMQRYYDQFAMMRNS